VAAVAATLWAGAVLPGRAARRAGPAVTVRALLSGGRSRRLLIASLLTGLASSVYWTFAVDHVQGDGGLSGLESRLFLAVVGLASIAGVLSAQLIDRFGGRATFVLALVAEAVALALLGMSPERLATVFASAVLFGTGYNVAVAVAVIWSARVHRARPSGGLAAIMVAQAVGLLAGPPAFGALADRAGFATAFGAAAAVLLAATACGPRERLGSP
jgi:predicted MFS family arabinose efflux permease